MSHVPPQYGAEADEELEELGDDVIIAQQSLAHAPQPRAQVHEEKRSIVISDVPAAGDPVIPSSYPSARSSRSRAEATVVIRDRRQIEVMRREVLRRHRRHERQDRRLYLWAGAALAAFVFGGLVALFVGSGSEEAPAVASSAGTIATAQPRSGHTVKQEPTQVTPAATSEPKTVDLEDLPVERGSRRR